MIKSSAEGFQAGPDNSAVTLTFPTTNCDRFNSIRRIQRDLKAYLSQTEPFLGVSAMPLLNDMFTWHGNIKTTDERSPYHGGVFHFELRLPKDYPYSAPEIHLFTQLPHPQVFSRTKVCLEMLETKEHILHKGWVPAYTIQGILMQLQIFLSSSTSYKDGMSAKDAVTKANGWICNKCKHRGLKLIDPPFSEHEAEDDYYVNIKSRQQIEHEGLTCYLTKAPLKEASLGVGVSFKKYATSGKINYVNPTIDLISMKAFAKMKVKKALDGRRFTHWLPLYFGEHDTFDLITEKYDDDSSKMEQSKKEIDTRARFEMHLKHGFNYMANNSTKIPFTDEQAIEIMTKLISTHVLDMLKDKRHKSVVSLRRLINFFRLFVYLGKINPSLRSKMEEVVDTFIRDPAAREKSQTQNLADLLVMSTVTGKFRDPKFIKGYLEEQLDRQVLWMLKEVPELDISNTRAVGSRNQTKQERNQICFDTGKVGHTITMLFHLLNESLSEACRGQYSQDMFSSKVDSNYGNLPLETEKSFVVELRKLNRKKNYQDYFEYVGYKEVKGDEAIYDLLIQAVKNSSRKKYHGSNHMSRYDFSKPEQQSTDRIYGLLEKVAVIDQEKVLVKPSTPKEPSKEAADEEDSEESDEFEMKVRSIKIKLEFEGAGAEDMWKKICYESFDIAKQFIDSHKWKGKLSPALIAEQHDFEAINRYYMDLKKLKEHEDKYQAELVTARCSQPDQELSLEKAVPTFQPGFTYRQLFAKLFFEQLMNDQKYREYFQIIYEFIKTFGADLESLKFKVVDTDTLSSGEFWWLGVIPKLKNLKSFKLYLDSDSRHAYRSINSNKLFSYMTRGFQYLQSNGGEITNFNPFRVFHGENSFLKDEYLPQILKAMPSLRVLDLSHNPSLSGEAYKAVGKILSDFRHITELNLSYNRINSQPAKDIADGMVRAKNLELVKLHHIDGSIECDKIIYNLAFSPKIRMIDLTKSKPSRVSDTVEALHKMMKISGSIESLLLGQTGLLNSLSQDFFKSIGESKSLVTLNLDSDRLQRFSQMSQLGNACAMNSFRNGNLRVLSIQRTIQSFTILEDFLSSFFISEQRHEEWFGSQNIAREMKHEQLERNLHCSLDVINMNGSSIHQNWFKMKNYENKPDPTWSVLFKFMAKAKVKTIDWGNCGITKGSEIFMYSFGANPLGKNIHLKHLNLANNRIGIDGAKFLAQALATNTSLEFLDLSQNNIEVFGCCLIAKILETNTTLKGLNLFKNNIDVGGARALRDLLKVNSTLEFLDVGHNRIRHKGLEALGDGIVEGVPSKLKKLAVRMNFISDVGFHKFFNQVIFSDKNVIEDLYINENNLSQYKALELQEKLKKCGSSLFVDKFEKLLYVKEEKTKRTVWFGPINEYTKDRLNAQIRSDFRDIRVGLLKMPVRYRTSKKIYMKNSSKNVYMFVELEDSTCSDVERMIMQVKKGEINIGSKAYLAGTNTFVTIKRSKPKGRKVDRNRNQWEPVDKERYSTRTQVKKDNFDMILNVQNESKKVQEKIEVNRQKKLTQLKIQHYATVGLQCLLFIVFLYFAVPWFFNIMTIGLKSTGEWIKSRQLQAAEAAANSTVAGNSTDGGA